MAQVTKGQYRTPPIWVKAKFANLRRYVPTGTYHAHAKVGGRLIRQSLKTKSIETAKAKLDQLLEKHRAAANRGASKESVGHFARVYLASVQSSRIKPRSKDYRRETWEMVERTWENLAGQPASSITKAACKEWADGWPHSSGRFNGCLETLRGIFKAAIAAGACLDDPTADLERASVPLEAPAMPSNEQFRAMLAVLDGQKHTKPAAITVRVLAFTGMRINEARHVAPEDIDLEAGWITVRVTKNGQTRRVPIIDDAKPVLERLAKGARIIDPRRALRTVSGGTLTPHDLRHLFATRCLESKVDVKTIAEWLGHSDGGALLLKRYAHLRDGHSQAMARKVKF